MPSARSVLGGRCTKDQATNAIRSLFEIPIAVEPSVGLIEEALALALKTSGTAYDALYVVMSLRKGVPFVTGDKPVCDTFAGFGQSQHISDFAF